MTASDADRKWRKYTPEIIGFMRENAGGRFADELAELVNEKFGTAYTYAQIRQAKITLGLRGGVHGRNKKPLLSETTENGFLYIKVSMTGGPREQWKRKHQWVWEQAHGPVPKGMRFIFLDGDKTNCDLDNLALLSVKERSLLAAYGLGRGSREEVLAGIAVVKHQLAVQDYLLQVMGNKGKKAFMGRVYRERKKLAKKNKGAGHEETKRAGG